MHYVDTPDWMDIDTGMKAFQDEVGTRVDTYHVVDVYVGCSAVVCTWVKQQLSWYQKRWNHSNPH